MALTLKYGNYSKAQGRPKKAVSAVFRSAQSHQTEIVVDLERAAAHREWQAKHSGKTKRESRKSRDKLLRELVRPVAKLLHPAEGVRRYLLKVPPRCQDSARAIGCQYDAASKFWYIDNPTNLSDLGAWRPVLMNLEAAAKTARTLHQKNLSAD